MSESWKKHYGVRRVGKTTDGQDVLKGLDVFKVNEALGVPLENIILFAQTNNCVIEWPAYVRAAHNHGWLMETIMVRLQTAITETYGSRYWDELKTRLMPLCMELMEQWFASNQFTK